MTRHYLAFIATVIMMNGKSLSEIKQNMCWNVSWHMLLGRV